MKSVIQAVAVAVALVAPVASFAQSQAPLTRAQVRAELVQLEKAGYRPGDSDNTRYPEAIQAAEAKVAAQDSAVGGGADGSSASGAPVTVPTQR
ncbi:DUF4148 domain-containing protein [Paraburkholderia silvatlantica]|uniref:DUF4148 domain-containing protein n=1 Tax=Paraburkholderia silvatlantica TaxID=321895 RepID=A0ABR6FKT0_9BURK|nr:DUF4148 domain-containing protein [Paraburkholderia silvatlantica]MBB2928026.1 hypothetical protein [Paraburkholderia silvatlantica]PVY30993.1 uncharacterized protein DUF4148 [Paraburkholderia silvatlantica]PXW37129.1 uncharacterized protein DUF4148 [Paraburkholderia silvatlantica]TDQ89436.1 uncharacterized protein DUF4148 [Paraburkholderia silvatlantica]